MDSPTPPTSGLALVLAFKQVPVEQVGGGGEMNSNSPTSSLLKVGPVSTRLSLSLNDNQRYGLMDSLRNSFLPPPVADEIYNGFEENDAEISTYIALQGEQFKKTLLEKFQASQIRIMSYVGKIAQKKLNEKEAEVDDLKKKMEEVYLETAAWKQSAQNNESMIKSLKFILGEVLGQNTGTGTCTGTRELMRCKVCRSIKICILVLPCKHLCLCKECDGKITTCPVCHTTKNVGLEVYI